MMNNRILQIVKNSFLAVVCLIVVYLAYSKSRHFLNNSYLKNEKNKQNVKLEDVEELNSIKLKDRYELSILLRRQDYRSMIEVGVLKGKFSRAILEK